jgi:tripartite-type tricarboxylate transporter receptor subunit TctC
VRFGSGGIGSSTHRAQALLNIRLGTDMLHIPYRGMLRLLAVSTAEPRARSPRTPVLDGKAGEFRVNNWYGLVAPPGLPPAILARLEAEAAKALALPRVRDAHAASGFTAAALPEKEFAPYLSREIARWKGVVTAARIEVES